MPKLFLSSVIMGVRPTALGAIFKKLIRIEREVVEVEHGQFFADPASHLGFLLLKHGEYEPQMYRVLSSTLTEGSVFIDLGANEGYFSVIASKLVGRSGRVCSIEPQRRLKPVFERNMELNRVDNVTLVDEAVSNQIGEATIHVSPSTDTGATGLVLGYKYPVPTETVRTTTLAEVFRRQQIDYCDLIKIDIEGFEYEAILGSPELFKQGRIRRLVLQLHPRLMLKRGLRPDEITEFLAACGYSIDDRFEELVFVAPNGHQPINI